VNQVITKAFGGINRRIRGARPVAARSPFPTLLDIAIPRSLDD